MKLWEAILIGCDRRAQAFGALVRHQNNGECHSCAIGAAMEATFGLDEVDGSNLTKFVELYPILFKTVVVDGVESTTVFERITDLNDEEQWAREKIALEFVKPLEDAMEVSTDE